MKLQGKYIMVEVLKTAGDAILINPLYSNKQLSFAKHFVDTLNYWSSQNVAT